MNTRIASIGAGLAVLAVVALIVLSSGEDDGGEAGGTGNAPSTNATGAAGDSRQRTDGGKQPQAEAGPPTIVIGADGKPVGGVAELTFTRDEQVRFKVESAVADHVHVHGYNLFKDLEPGGTVSFDFEASIEGIFEAELEDRGEQILELRIEP